MKYTKYFVYCNDNIVCHKKVGISGMRYDVTHVRQIADCSFCFLCACWLSV